MATCELSERPGPTTVLFPHHGLSVTRQALEMLWDLEARHLTVKLDPTRGCLLVGPASRLTSDDDAAIREHRDELIALVRVCGDEVVA